MWINCKKLRENLSKSLVLTNELLPPEKKIPYLFFHAVAFASYLILCIFSPEILTSLN